MERTGSLIGIWMLSPRRLGFDRVYAKSGRFGVFSNGLIEEVFLIGGGKCLICMLP